MNRNRNRNASPAAKSEIGCRCSQTHSRSTHSLTHTYIQKEDGQGETTVGFLMMGHTLTGQSPRGRHLSTQPAWPQIPLRRPSFPSVRCRRYIRTSPTSSAISHLSLPLHPHRKSPPSPTTPADTLAYPSASPISHRVASHPSKSAMRSARSLALLQTTPVHPHRTLAASPSQGRNAACKPLCQRRTPYAHAHATPRRRRSLSRDFERERRIRQSRRNAAHCISCTDRPSCKVNPTSYVHRLRPPTRKKSPRACCVAHQTGSCVSPS
ncbi:hypothetical protein GQ607_007544 [Colletotrichum asianum]|uniref:Uncharacterized protein n=1 Tax=Colletotrichum asianum TaxID=702518 RepID=A0A8H3WII7_9PEZI|nr:hypothetical protein GQ607_007544 [Colletotrichum asianum]